MVKKSKKSKSKRVPLKKKYKIIRKVKEHHKKKAKEAKKLGLNNKKKVEKDPGIPNDWPFKEQELKALEARRARAIEELEQKKAERKERARKRKLGLLEDDGVSQMTETEGQAQATGTASGKNRDNADKPFYKELVKVVEASDVILEVLDARDPLGTRCTNMEKMVMSAGPDKRLVLLLNKIDLVPREAVEKWLKYLREELPTVAFKCSTQEQRSKLGWKSSKAAKPSNILQTSDCLGADTLIKVLKNYTRSHEIKKTITVGVIGLPNVGKSSLINSLKRAHVVNVGATPGLTRSMQEVQLDKNIKLLDCPGVVMLKSLENDASVALRNCKRIEKLDDPISPVKEILNCCPARLMVTLYKIPSFDSVDDFLQKVAAVRGKLKKGGVADVEAAARIILRDWNEGKIPYYTMPPVRDEGEVSEATIVSEFAKEFNIDEVYRSETSFIGSLKSADDFNPVEVPSSGPLKFNESTPEDDMAPEPSNQVEQEPENPAGNDVDETMECQEDGNKNKGKSAADRQNEKLYGAEGMLNTKLQRAEKKRRKKANKGTSDAMDDDYDFKVDYFKKGTAMSDGDDDDQIKIEVPMAGILDNEG
ncbi:guanine nucleotide-binding protein-like NSN1 [Arachis duranensis]|uniref:Guanine nucleotide-binding protein-like NSN1 n=1 Tax=Arachis duranensis TaxID=130453 RepID=A0A6P4C790_ARADU|nr:guanine nucleotide-binding protein-like NSN1 [Arachis duranensis]